MQARTLNLGPDRSFLAELLAAALREKILVALLLLDFLLIILHVSVIGFHRYGQLPEWAQWFSITKDGSLPEIIEYLKGITAGALLLRVSLTHSPVLMPMAILPLYMVLDNALEIHEQANDLLPQDGKKAELAFLVGVGVLMAAAASFAYVRANARERAAIVSIASGMMLIGIAAAGLDAATVLIKRVDYHLGRIFAWLEDGGELIAQSLLLVVCVVVWKNASKLRDHPSDIRPGRS